MEFAIFNLNDTIASQWANTSDGIRFIFTESDRLLKIIVRQVFYDLADLNRSYDTSRKIVEVDELIAVSAN